MKSKKIFLFFISIFLSLVFVIYLFYQAGFKKVFKILFLLSWWQMLAVFLIEILIFLLLIKKWQILTRPYGYKNRIKKLIPAFLGKRVISYLTPIMYVGGEGFKAYLIKKSEEKSFIQTFGLIIVDRIAEGIALLFFLALGGIISLLAGAYILGFFLILISLGLIILIIVFSRLPNIFYLLIKIFKFHKIAKQEINEHRTLQEKIDEEINLIKDFFQKRRKYFNLDVLLSFFYILFACSQIYLLMSFWGHRLYFFKIYLIRTFGILAGLVPTPGSLGGFEGAMAFIFMTLNLNLEHALSLSLVIRFIQLIFVAIGIFFVIPYLTKFIIPLIFRNNKPEKPTNS